MYAKDCVEIMEGVRECEMIATAISGTNTLTIQIATNRSELAALDSVIVGLIPQFVNHTKINDWLASGVTNPPHWTENELYAYVGLSEGMTPYPYQIRTNELWQRYIVLTNLFMTDTPSTWTGGRGGYTYVYDKGYEYGGDSFSTNIPPTYNPHVNEVTNNTIAATWWNNYGKDTKPDWWTDCYGHERTVTFNGYYIGSSQGTRSPMFSWSISIEISLILSKYAAYNSYASQWGINWYRSWSSTRSYTSFYVESLMATSTKSIPITRIDNFYTATFLCSTNIGTNTASSVSPLYVTPPGSVNPSLTYSREICVLDSPVLHWNGVTLDRTISFNSTNTENATLSDSGSTTQINRNVIHVWNKARCISK